MDGGRGQRLCSMTYGSSPSEPSTNEFYCLQPIVLKEIQL